MPPKPKFADGERVLCFHGNLLYEAKCVKSEAKEKATRYFIHYNGWNKNWDEWVPESRVLKFNDAGLQKQKELQKAHAGSKGSKRGGQVGRPKRAEKGADKDKDKTERAATPTTESRAGRAEKRKGADKNSDRGSRASTPTVEATPKDRTDKRKLSATSTETKIEKERDRSKDKEKKDKLDKDKELKEKDKEKENADQPKAGDKRKNTAVTAPATSDTTASEPKKKRTRIEATVEPEEVYTAKIEIRIKLPEEVKPWLVDDWDLITRQKMLVSLPCKVTVDDILEDYIKFKTSKGNHPQKDAIVEMTCGIRDYFNVMLGTQLLYKFERIQYSEVLADHPDVPMCKIYGITHLVRLFVRLGSMLAYTPLDEKSVSFLLMHLNDFLRYVAKNGTHTFNVSDYIVAPPEYHRKAM